MAEATLPMAMPSTRRRAMQRTLERQSSLRKRSELVKKLRKLRQGDLTERELEQREQLEDALAVTESAAGYYSAQEAAAHEEKIYRALTALPGV